MGSGKRDIVIDELEAEIRESQFNQWDAEAFLIKRHQAKIEKLREPRSKILSVWEGVKELGTFIFAYVGFAGVCCAAALWLLTGSFIPRSEPVMLPPASIKVVEVCTPSPDQTVIEAPAAQ